MGNGFTLKWLKVNSLDTILIVLFGLILVKNSLLVYIGPLWYGEDEPSHFGYIESLAHSRKWMNYENNFRSLELVNSIKQISEEYGEEWKKIVDDNYKTGRYINSTEYNDTRYQPPLYYWIMAKVYLLNQKMDIISLVYLFRQINVIIGLFVIINLWWLLKLLKYSYKYQFALVLFLGFHPMYSWMTSTITVQVSLIWWFSVYLLFVFKLIKSRFGYPFWIILNLVCLLASYTQQMGLILWMFNLVLIGVTLYHKNIPLKRILTLIVLMSCFILCLKPFYIDYHKKIVTVNEDKLKIVRTVNIWEYVITQQRRLTSDLVEGFWYQKRGLVPYRMSEGLIRLSRFMFIVLVLSISMLFKGIKKLAVIDQVFLILLGMGLLVFLAFFGYFDFFQYQHDQDAYFKGRYLFPLLPLLMVNLVKVMKTVANIKWMNLVISFFISLTIIFNLSAMMNLIINIYN